MTGLYLKSTERWTFSDIHITLSPEGEKYRKWLLENRDILEFCLDSDMPLPRYNAWRTIIKRCKDCVLWNTVKCKKFDPRYPQMPIWRLALACDELLENLTSEESVIK